MYIISTSVAHIDVIAGIDWKYCCTAICEKQRSHVETHALDIITDSRMTVSSRVALCLIREDWRMPLNDSLQPHV